MAKIEYERIRKEVVRQIIASIQVQCRGGSLPSEVNRKLGCVYDMGGEHRDFQALVTRAADEVIEAIEKLGASHG